MTMTVVPAPRPTVAPVSLPPPELREEFGELDKACSEIERLREERSQVRRDLDAAHTDRRAAEHADIADAAKAHRAGKADPGQSRVEAVDERIRQLKRRAEIISTALESAGADLADVIAQHRAAWAAKTASTVQKRRTVLRETAMKWGDLRHEVAALESLKRWLSTFPAKSYTTGTRYMATYGPEGSRVLGSRSFDTVLDELLFDAEGPQQAVRGNVALSEEAA